MTYLGKSQIRSNRDGLETIGPAVQTLEECDMDLQLDGKVALIPGGSRDRARREKPEAFAAYERDGFPMGRLGNPEEVADIIVFLASAHANWINGRNIPVDGLEQPVPFQPLEN